MGVTLACTWRPRAEGARWRALYPQLTRLYDQIVIVVPTDADGDQVQALQTALGSDVSVAPRPSCQRYEALRRAVESGTAPIHCADGDRLLHWAETRFDELKETVSVRSRWC